MPNKVAALLLALSFSTGSFAQQRIKLSQMNLGYTYFNRINSNIHDHNTKIFECIDQIIYLRSTREDFHRNMNNDEGLANYIFDSWLTGNSNKAVFASALENCMVANGWRVMELTEADGSELSKLSASELAEKISPWIGSSTPHGSIVRTWRNEASDANNDRFSSEPKHKKEGQLSLKVALGKGARAVSGELTRVRRALPPPPKIKRDKRWPKGPIKTQDIDKIPQESAVVLMNVRGIGFSNGNGFKLTRVDENDVPPPLGSPLEINFFVGAISGKGEGNLRAFAVPAGRWRIASMMGGAVGLDFCFGAPSFRVHKGEAVYTGMLDLASNNMQPKFDIEIARQFFIGTRFYGKIKQAEYTNGSRDVCRQNAAYALEFDGMPFEPDYKLGSKAIAE